MGIKKAKEITLDVSREYLAYGNELGQIQAEMWEEELSGWNKEKAKEAVRKLLISKPGYKQPYEGKMPDLDDLKEIYLRLSTPKHQNCPCCDNTRWIQSEKGYFIKCECVTGKPIDPQIKCNSLGCAPDKTRPCPLGEEHYKETRKRFLKKIKNDPGYKKGLKLSKGHSRGIAEKLTREIKDIPGAGADELPS